MRIVMDATSWESRSRICQLGNTTRQGWRRRRAEGRRPGCGGRRGVARHGGDRARARRGWGGWAWGVQHQFTLRGIGRCEPAGHARFCSLRLAEVRSQIPDCRNPGHPNCGWAARLRHPWISTAPLLSQMDKADNRLQVESQNKSRSFPPPEKRLWSG